MGAPPASNPRALPLPLPLPRCHMKRGLQVGGPPITQHQCGERPLPGPPADSLLLAQGTGCVLTLWRRKLLGTGGRAWTVSQWWSVWTSGSPWEGLGLDPLPGTPEGAGRWSGPQSTKCVIHDHPGVCVCCRRGLAGAAYITWARRRSTENPQVWTQRLAGLGEWAPVWEQARVPRAKQVG